MFFLKKSHVSIQGGSNLHRPISLPLLWTRGSHDGLAGRKGKWKQDRNRKGKWKPGRKRKGKWKWKESRKGMCETKRRTEGPTGSKGAWARKGATGRKSFNKQPSLQSSCWNSKSLCERNFFGGKFSVFGRYWGPQCKEYQSCHTRAIVFFCKLEQTNKHSAEENTAFWLL